MILAVDAGNSRIKWGLHSESGWVAQGAASRAELADLAGQWAGLPPPERVIVSNVAGPAVQDALAEAFRPWPLQADWVTVTEEQCGVRNGYAQPGQLGSDRWAALIAARQMASGPCVVASLGTALTVDALAGDGRFLGGFIVPGLRLMENTLAKNTAAITLEKGRFRPFPDNTADACRSGALAALAGAVEKMHRQLARETAADCLCLVSGGDAPLLLPMLAVPARHVENLVLEGLLRIAQS